MEINLLHCCEVRKRGQSAACNGELALVDKAMQKQLRM